MSEEQAGAAAPANEQAVTAPAVAEQATPKDGIRDVDAAPENAEAKVETKAEDGKSEGEEERKRLSRSQRQQRKIARLSTMVAEQATELDGLRKTAQSSQDAEPKEADFNGDYFAWQRALNQWDTKKLLKEVLPQSAPDKKQPDARDLNRQEATQEFFELAEQLKTSIPDFDQTIKAFDDAGHKLAPHVIEELLEIGEKGPLLAYQFAKTPHLAAELNAMSPRDAAREIGRLEAKATLPERKTQTKAPAPLTPLRGGAAATASLTDLAKGDDATAYIEARRRA